VCGSLKLEGQKDFIPQGNYVPVEFIIGVNNKKGFYFWPRSGFARLDGNKNKQRALIDQWSPEKWTAGAIKIESFKEASVVFKSNRLGCLLNHEEKVLRILTRPAKTPKEIAIHHRAPSRIPMQMEFNDWLSRLNKLSGGNYRCLQ